MHKRNITAAAVIAAASLVLSLPMAVWAAEPAQESGIYVGAEVTGDIMDETDSMFDVTLSVLPDAEDSMENGWAILGYDKDTYGSGCAVTAAGGAQEHFYGVRVNGAFIAGTVKEGDLFYQGMKAGQAYEALDRTSGEAADTYTAQEDIPTVIDAVIGAQVEGDGSVSFLEGASVNTKGPSFLYRDGDAEFTFSGAQAVPENGILLQLMDNDEVSPDEIPQGQDTDPDDPFFQEEAGFPTEAWEAVPFYVLTKDTEPDPSKTYYAEAGSDIYMPVEEPVKEDIASYYEIVYPSKSHVTLTIENGEYTGDVYNATGYFGQVPDSLEVTIAKDAVLNGDIALASHVHGMMLNDRKVDDVTAAIEKANKDHEPADEENEPADAEDEPTDAANESADAENEPANGANEPTEEEEDTDQKSIQYVFLDENGDVTPDKKEAAGIQFTRFTSQEACLLMQVVNRVFYNGKSTLAVVAEGTWKPSSESLVTYLEISNDAHVFGKLYDLGDGSILILPSEKEITPGVYGTRP